MNNHENNTDKNSLAYKAGYMLGYIMVGCSAALILALTIKIIFWLFR